MNDGNNEKSNHLCCNTGYIFVTQPIGPIGLISLIGLVATLSAACRLKIQFLTFNF